MKNLLVILSLILAACGDSTVIVPTTADEENDAETQQDQGDDGSDPLPDLPLPDLPTPPDPVDPVVPNPDDPIVEPEPMPPVVQPAYKVQQSVDEQCSTGAVKGLSVQLLDQMNCLSPGIMKSFGGSGSINYSASVFPFQQGPATDTLLGVVAGGGTLTVNSALRTLPQQYLLYQWYLRGLCNANLAARPGASNHNGGLALDINDSGTWRTRMRNKSYIDNVSGEAWHFYYSGAGGKDVRNLSVLAFQQLWNKNYPDEKLDEDGAYGPKTESALKRSPAEGFAIPPMCMSTMQFVGYPFDVPIEALIEEDQTGDSVFRVSTTSGIDVIEYRVDGEVIQSVSRQEDPFFTARLDLPNHTDVEVVAYDREGRVRGSSTALLRADFIARPLGDGNYSVMPRDPNVYLDPVRVPSSAHVVPGWREMLITIADTASFDVSLLK